MNLLKLKILFAKMLCNTVTGRIISICFRDKIPFNNSTIYTKSPYISDEIKAAIFWHFYESAEIRFVHRHLPPQLDVIELGSSIGVMGSQIGKIIKNKKLICVEANPFYKSIIERNLQSNGISNYNIISAAISTAKCDLFYEKGESNIAGRIVNASDVTQKDAIKVPGSSLSEILADNNIGPYSLVCDIEGSELDILINDSQSLHSCKFIIIETHPTNFNGHFFSIEKIKELILAQQFRLVEEYGPVMVFERS